MRPREGKNEERRVLRGGGGAQATQPRNHAPSNRRGTIGEGAVGTYAGEASHAVPNSRARARTGWDTPVSQC